MITRTERDFALLEAAAAAGDRCPCNHPHGPLSANSITLLVAQGRVRSEVYRHNWRVVTILDGPQKGKATAPPLTDGLRPYIVNGVYVKRFARRFGKIAP